MGLVLPACALDDYPQPNTPRSEVPDALTGVWMDEWSLASKYYFDPQFYNETTKVWFRGSQDPWSMDPRPGNGLQVEKNGSFVWYLATGTGVGGCRSHAADFSKGTVVAEGTKLTFHPTVRRKKYHSVCNSGLNYDCDEAQTAFSVTYEVTRKRMAPASNIRC